MQVILKSVGKGKTAEAIKAAYIAANDHPVLIVSSEEHPTVLTHRINMFSLRNPEFPNRYDIVTSDSIVTPEMFSDPEQFKQFGTIVLDVNFGMSRAPWLTVCADLEEFGYNVIVTQQLVKPEAKQLTFYH